MLSLLHYRTNRRLLVSILTMLPALSGPLPTEPALAQTNPSGSPLPGNTVKDMLAAQIRTQGVACEQPKRAIRDAKRSRPDYEVWVLQCSNATYRISRYPDMAAKVEQLR